MKKIFLFVYSIMVVASLFAGGGLDSPWRAIEKTDLSKTPGRGETEIYFNYTWGENPVLIYLNEKLVAQCDVPIESKRGGPEPQPEKIITKTGSVKMDAVIIRPMYNDKKKQWDMEELARHSGKLSLDSSAVTIDIEAYHSWFTKLEINDNMSQGGNSASSAGIEYAVRDAGSKMAAKLPNRSIVAILSISSTAIDMAEYAIEELEYVLVNSAETNLTIVDRKNLDKIRSELRFQMSGDVDDASAISIGKSLGASVVIIGSISGSGSLRRFRVRALDVKTAAVLASEAERF